MAHSKAQAETFNNIIQILKDLHHDFPNQNILRHVADATEEYGNIWGIENKEFLLALQKYKANMYIPEDTEIEKIIEDGKKLGLKKKDDFEVNLEDEEDIWQ